MRNATYLTCLLLIIIITGCGRVGYPFAPEELGSQPVRSLIVLAKEDGIEFNWKPPQTDVRGEPLKSLDEYRIIRKSIERTSDFLDTSIEFELLASIPDRYISKLKDLEDEALKAGTPRRKVKVPEDFTKYTYFDRSLEKGKRYLYQILPVNQGNVVGQSQYFIDVLFQGLNTQITLSEALDAVAPEGQGEDMLN